MFGGFGDRYSLRLARELFIKAAEIDPGYARAYAGIAECDAALRICGGTDISYQEILANSNKALSFAPNLAEAHASKGLALFLSGHVEEATMAFERAIELDSELFEVYEWYGEVCKNTGRFSKATVLFERAGELRLAKSDPRNADLQNDLSVSYNKVGDVQVAQSNLPAALTSYRASLAIRERLAKSDPGNAGWRREGRAVDEGARGLCRGACNHCAIGCTLSRLGSVEKGSGVV
jgi:tetratricopeptide (TPR) repeat protein